MRSDALCAYRNQPTTMDFDSAARNGVCVGDILDYSSRMSSIAIGGFAT
jgi:hypothetical protein